MSRLRKVLSIFMILVILIFTSSLSVFVLGAATSPAGSSSPQTSEPDTSAIPGVPPSSSAKPSSSAASVPSSKPSSSAASSKQVKAQSSSEVSSEASSDAAGGLSSEESSSSSISLPSVGSVSEVDPLSSAASNPDSAQNNKWIGIISWTCIALGVLVVLVVVLTNRRPPRGMGRKRYRRSKRSSGKHLLNDRYYRNINRY